MNAIAFALAILCQGTTVRVEDVERAADQHALDPIVLVVLMADESTCNPRAVNRRTGAVGLLQILPEGSANPDQLTMAQLLDPDANMDLGAAAVSRLLALCGNLGQALTLYRGGGKRDPDTGRTKCQTDDHSRGLLKRIRWVKQQFKQQIRRTT